MIHVATTWLPPMELLKGALEDEIRRAGPDATAAKASLAADLAPTAISAAEKAAPYAESHRCAPGLVDDR